MHELQWKVLRESGHQETISNKRRERKKNCSAFLLRHRQQMAKRSPSENFSLEKAAASS